MPSRAPKRVLVTRSRQQASALAAELQALGLEAILIPTIAIAPPTSYAALDQAIAHLPEFDWLLFTSANAAEAFAQRNAHLAQSEPASLQPRIAAIGPATARALTAAGLRPHLIPAQAVAESLAQALLPHAPGARMLLIRAETARDLLPDTLRAAGADLTIAPAYRNLIPPESIPLLQSLFATPETLPDAITFTSSSTATNLLALLEAAGLTLPADGDQGRTILRASIGPITSDTLRQLGYPPHLEAPNPTVSSLAQTLAAHLAAIP